MKKTMTTVLLSLALVGTIIIPVFAANNEPAGTILPATDEMTTQH